MKKSKAMRNPAKNRGINANGSHQKGGGKGPRDGGGCKSGSMKY